MTDRELLELAAKAAGMNEWRWYEPAKCLCHYNVKMRNWYSVNYGDKIKWNPLTDDGDALRLAVKLGFGLDVLLTLGATELSYGNGDDTLLEYHNKDPYAATRRAIVRAAAEIGKELK